MNTFQVGGFFPAMVRFTKSTEPDPSLEEAFNQAVTRQNPFKIIFSSICAIIVLPPGCPGGLNFFCKALSTFLLMRLNQPGGPGFGTGALPCNHHTR